MCKKYIHYGSSEFKKDLVTVQHKHCIPGKPRFGIWASPVEPNTIGWKDWCIKEEYHFHNLTDYFIFTLTKDAKVLTVERVDDIAKYIVFDDILFYGGRVDCDAIIKDGYDAIELIIDDALYWLMYGWDCDSIVIFNPDIIVLEDEC